jgi:fructuronate reductase
MTARLSDATLGGLPASVARPRYDRSALTPGIVHLGVGAFHRAHQAVATEAALNAGARDWGIVAASLRSPDTRESTCVIRSRPPVLDAAGPDPARRVAAAPGFSAIFGTDPARATEAALASLQLHGARVAATLVARGTSA